MRDDAARYLQEYKTSFFCSDISGSFTEIPQNDLQALKSYILLFWDISFVWLGARLSNFLRNLLTLPSFSYTKLEAKIFPSVGIHQSHIWKFYTFDVDPKLLQDVYIHSFDNWQRWPTWCCVL